MKLKIILFHKRFFIFSLIFKFRRNTFSKFMEHRLKTTYNNLPNFLFCSVFNYNSYRQNVHDQDAYAVYLEPLNYIILYIGHMQATIM